jgi:transposase
VHARLLENLKTSSKLFADETTLPVLDPGRGRTKTGQLWTYARDDRPWGGADPPGVAYVYAPNRKAEQPIKHLAGFKGVLQVHGYGVYRPLAEKGEVKLAFCWAHVRRPFYELHRCRSRTHRRRDAGADQGALRRRSRDQGLARRTSPRRAPGENSPPDRSDGTVAPR